MRISNPMILRSSVARVQQPLQAMDRAREQVASGLRVRRMSDDPTAASEVVRIGASMRAVAQYQRNINLAKARVATEENALDQLGNALTRAVELGLGQVGATANTTTRLAVKAEIDQLLGFAVDLGNTRFGDDFLFAGPRAGERPFRVPTTPGDGFSALLDGNGDPVDPTGTLRIEIGDGRTLTPNHSGAAVFLDTDALEALRALSDALGADDPAAIATAATRANAAHGRVQALLGTVGARTNELEAAEATLAQTELTLAAVRSDLRDAEIDKAMIELVGRQTMYQAAMSATSRILGLSLANYL
jgi:flagellar hook-associated protein 3 FlgL